MKRTFIALFGFVYAIGTMAQVTLKSRWQNGNLFFYTEEKKVKGMFHLSGGSCHEGGYEFCLQPNGENKYIYKAVDEEFAYSSLNAPFESKVVCKTILGTQHLLVYKDGRLVEVLKKMGKNQYLQDVLVQDIKNMFEGVYTDKKTGAEFVLFGEDGKTIKGIPGVKSFEVQSEFETPCNVLKLNNGKYVRLKFTIDGINLYYTELNGDDCFSEEDDRLAYKLVKVKSCLAEKAGIKGFWPLASSSLLTIGFLNSYPNEILQLMKNEIYARHGHRFNAGGKMEKYFSAQPWYKPAEKETPLTEVEEMNVMLIQAVMQMEDRYPYELAD